MEGNIKKSQIRTMAKDLERFRPARSAEQARRAETNQSQAGTPLRTPARNAPLAVADEPPVTPMRDEQENKTKESKQPRELRTEPKPETKITPKSVEPQPSELKEEHKLSEILAEARKRVSQTEPALGRQAPSASPEPESITTTQKPTLPTSPTRAEAELSDKTEPSTQKIPETRTDEAKESDKTAIPPKTISDLLPIEPFGSAQGKPLDSVQGKPFDPAQGKPSSTPPSPTRTFDSAQGKPFGSAPAREARLAPEERQGKPMGTGVPSNLPIGEPSLAVPDERPLPPAPPSERGEPASEDATRRTALPTEEKTSVSISPPQLKPEPMDRQAGKTPEEILGLSALPKLERDEPAKSVLTKRKEPSPKEEALTPNLEKIVRAPERPSIKPPSQTRLRPRVKLNLRAMPTPKFIIISGILGIILISVSYGIYWKLFLQSEPSAPIPPIPQISEPAVPQPLIDFEERRIIEITSLKYDALKPKIDILASVVFLPQSLVYVPIKHISDTERRFISLSEIFQILQIDAPPAILDPKNFTLYAYSPADEEKELCVESGITDKSCYGPRLGIVMELWNKGEGILTKDTAISVMGQWEKTIINDIRPMLLASPTIPADYIPGEKFGISKYKNFDIHYKNFPISAISIDWLVSDKYLIIATSKNAARAAVDNLK